jgi:hypothetical protein
MTELAFFSPSLSLSQEPLYPNPFLSASIYCCGRLDEVIHSCIAQFWVEARHRDETGTSYLWVMRYAKGGDHLKVRLHGPEGHRFWMRELLAAAVESYFSALEPPEVDAPRKNRDLATPIDHEDRVPTLYPDRTLLWTVYERSHISLGYRPYMNDDVYVSRLTRCLGRSTDVLLSRLETDSSGRSSHQVLQAILLKALIAGLSALPFNSQERTLYLLYHRDCLLRAVLKQAGSRSGPQKMEETLNRFRQQVHGMGESIDRLAWTAGSLWQTREEGNWDNDFEAWRGALRELADYASLVCGDLAHHIDPFAEHPLFPPLFKAFHGFANQLGLTALNEAFAHYLLIAATSDDGLRDRPVQLKPSWLKDLKPQ